MTRYVFSGHESFTCKSLWLKKGYDYLNNGYKFREPDAVVTLGVGKNMVSSIRCWMKAFGLTEEDKLTEFADYIFSNEGGIDMFTEDMATLWLLHWNLVNTNYASIYSLAFVEFQRERREFDRKQLQMFIKRRCSVPEQKNVYNENTVKKDIDVLLRNYVFPKDIKDIEKFSSLLLELNLISTTEFGLFQFNEISPNSIAPEVILYALLDSKGDNMVISNDLILNIALSFCLLPSNLIHIIRVLEKKYPQWIEFTDNSGIKNVNFLQDVDKFEVLNEYYKNL